MDAGEVFQPQLFPELGINLAELMGEAAEPVEEAQDADASAE